MAELTRIDVRAERPYPVLVGPGASSELLGLIGPDAQRVAVLHPPTMINAAEKIVHALTAAGREPVRIDVPDAEAAKTATVLARCWSVLGTAGFTRSDAVIGVGGGSTTDLAGFVAATWLRGVRLVTVPTSLLGHGGRRRRGKDGDQHRRGQEPGRQLLRAGRRALRPRPAGLAAPPGPGRRAGRGDQVRFHRRSGDPDPDRGRPGGGDTSGLAGAARPDRAGDPGQGPGGVGRPAGVDLDRLPGGARVAQLRPHAGSRHRTPGGLPLAPRCGGQRRAGVRRRTGPAGRPVGRRRPPIGMPKSSRWSACPPGTPAMPSRTCWAPWRWTRRPAAPPCGS